jgi:putative membrane protein
MPGNRLKTHWPILTLIAVVLISTAWSAYHPREVDTWFFELIFGWIGFVILVVTYRWFRFSALSYLACAFFFIILSWGAKYTYEYVPWFNWLRDTFGLSRNHADRFGHFFQGFVPALLTRELIMRTSTLRGKWLASISIAMPLAYSAFYELLEMWWAETFYPGKGPEWLGHQGDPWDAQWDMTMALLGAMLAVLVFRKLHDYTIRQVVEVSDQAEASESVSRAT